MKAIKVTENFWISTQPQPDGFAEIAEQGFSSVINLRQDNEGADQPDPAALRAASEAAGMDYHFIPVASSDITDADIQAFGRALDDAGRVLAFCDTGKSALTLFALSELRAGRMKPHQIPDFGKAHGFDPAETVSWLASDSSLRPMVRGFYDSRTGSIQYVVSDPDTRRCAIIDPVYDFDEKSGATDTGNADRILDYIRAEGLEVEWILDTHPHADHFSAAHYLHLKTGAPTAIGAQVTDVQKLWQGIYNWPDLATDGSQWNRLFRNGDRFSVGGIEGRVIFSPGHTLASVTYVIGDAAFIHDTIFMPDTGTARADFPGGSAKALWGSIQEILALPDDTRLFTGHDYRQGGRSAKWESTVALQKRTNPHLAGIDQAGFIALREARDRTLPMPRLILFALQVNIQGGRLPAPETNGRRYLRYPLDALEGAAW